MSKPGKVLRLIFEESAADPLILESSWETASGRERLALQHAQAKKRLAALSIVFLLAKYEATRPNCPLSTLCFKPSLPTGTWLHTLTNSEEEVAEWIKREFSIASSDRLFVKSGYGSMHIPGGKTLAKVEYRLEMLPPATLDLAKSSEKRLFAKPEPMEGRALVDFALKIEQKYWKQETIKERYPELFGIMKGRAGRGVVALRREAMLVCKFLRNLAEKGLSRGLLFPPPEGQSLRDFCIEPMLITEGQWEQYVKRNTGGSRQEMELSSEEAMRMALVARPATLGRILGDETYSARHRRVILRGNPGEGKSTALWLHVNNQCALLTSRLESGELGIMAAEFKAPLVLPLGEIEIEKASLVKQAIDKVLEISFGADETSEAEEIRKWLGEKVKRAEYSLALDALDELPSLGGRGQSWLRKEIRDIPHSVAVFVTTRPNLIDTTLGLGNGQSAGQFEIYRITCFGELQICRCVRRYFGSHEKKVESLLRRLQQSPGPKQLSRLPLLLAVLCHLHYQHEPASPLPSTRADLLGAALWSLFENGHRKRVRNAEKASDPIWDGVKERLLQRVALKFWKDGPLLMRDKDLHTELSRALRSLKPVERGELKGRSIYGIVEELCEDGILVKIAAGRGIHYRFLLRSLHEYLVGGFFASEPKRAARLLICAFVKKRGWENDDWQHIWVLAAGQGADVAKQLLSIFNPPKYFVFPFSNLEGKHVSDKFPVFLGRIVAEAKIAPRADWAERLTRLRGFDRWVDRAITEALGELGGEDAEKQLLEWLLDESESRYLPKGTVTDMHMEVAMALSKIASNETIELLVQRLNDTSVDVSCRRGIAYLLGQVGGSCSREGLIACLGQKDDAEGWLRRECAGALGSIADGRAKDVLIAVLSDANELSSIRAKSATNLGGIADPASRNALIKCLQGYSGDELVRASCAAALGEVGDMVSCQALIESLKDHSGKMNGAIRRACARALGRVASEQSRRALLESLDDWGHDPDGTIRKECVSALKELGDEASQSAIAARLKDASNDSNGVVRYACAVALRTLPKAEQRSVLGTRLMNSIGDEDGKERCACAEALGNVASTESRAALLARLNDASGDPDGRVRVACVEALTKIGGPESFNALDTRLRVDADDENGAVRYACAKALGVAGEREFRSVVIARLNECGRNCFIDSEDCIRDLVRLGDSESRRALIFRLLDRSSDYYRIRKRCADALGEMRDTDARTALIEVLNERSGDFHGIVRASCARALGKIGGDESRSALIAHLANRGYVGRYDIVFSCAAGLGQIGDTESRRALTMRLLDSTDDFGGWIRMGCAEALGQLPGQETRSALAKRLGDHTMDDYGNVRRACAMALGKLQDGESRNVLIARLGDPEGDETGDIRAKCAQALFLIGDRESQRALIKRLNDGAGDETGFVRVACVKALGGLGRSRKVLQRIFKRTRTPENVRQACYEALW